MDFPAIIVFNNLLICKSTTTLNKQLHNLQKCTENSVRSDQIISKDLKSKTERQ